MRIGYPRGSFLRSPPAVAALIAVAIAALGVLQAALNAPEWVGNWRATSAGLRYATLWGACITAAAAAWVMAAPRRGRYAAMLTVASQPAWRIYRPALLAVIGGSIAGYVVVAAYAVLTTRGAATHGSLNVLEMAPALGWTMAGAGAGVVAGCLLPPMVAPVAAAILPYLLPALGATVDFSTGRTFFGDLLGLDDAGRDQLRVPAQLLIGKSLLWILLGAAVLAWTLHGKRPAGTLALLAGLAAAASFPVAGARYDVPAEHAVACAGDRPRVCTDRAHDHLLARYHRLVQDQLDRLDGLSLAGYTVVPGTAPGLGADQVVVEIATGYTSPAHQIDQRTFPARFGAGLFLTPCLAGPVEDFSALTDAAARSTMLYAWWLQHSNLPTNGSNYTGELSVDDALTEDPGLADRTRKFSALSDADRAAWLRRNSRAVLTCAPGADR